MGQFNGYAKPGVGSTLGILIVGMAACAAWAWTAYPAQVSSLAGRLTSPDYVLLAVFVVVDLVATSMLASMIQAVMQLVLALVQVALLVGAAVGGVLLWRAYGAEDGPSVTTLPSAAWSTETTHTTGGVPVPYSAQEPMDPELRRQELEAELLELDTRDGGPWWDHD